MKKIAWITTLVLSLLVPIGVHATDAGLTQGETHAYTVQMRSDQQAITYARLIFANSSEDNDRTNYSFRLPRGVKADKVTVQQILAPKKSSTECKTYETFEEWQQRRKTIYGSGSSSYYTSPSYLNQSRYESERQCKERVTNESRDEKYNFTTVPYSGNYSSSSAGKVEYTNLQVDEKEGDYTVKLSEAVKPGKEGAVLVSYVSKGFISNTIGYYTYDYRTLMVDSLIKTVTVTINFDKELYSREAKQQRATESVSTSGGSSLNAGASLGRAQSNRSLDEVQQKIVRGGTIQKTQEELLPNDTLSIKGVYTTSKWMLYLKEIGIGLGLLLVALIVGFFGYRYYRKHHKESVRQEQLKPDKPLLVTTADKEAGGTILSAFEVETRPDASLRHIIFTILVTVFASSIVIPMAVAIISSQMTASVLAYVLVIAVICIVMLVAMVVPLVYMLKFSRKSIIRWVIAYIITLIVIGQFAWFIASMMDHNDRPTYYDTPRGDDVFELNE